MALVQCAECGARVSDQAPSCPQCGYVPRSSGGLALLMSLFRIVMLLLAILGFFAGFTNPMFWVLSIVCLLLGVVVSRVA